MRRNMVAMGLVLAGLAGACGDDGSASSSGGGSTTGTASGGGGDAGTGLPSSGVGAVDDGEPHTPATGCHDGFVACGDLCVRTEDDARHCGGCDQDCGVLGCDEAGVSCGCVASACVADEGCPYGPTCDGACVDPLVYTNVDHCGSCDNRCGDLALCVDAACRDTEGDGSSCERPIFWTQDSERAGFRFTDGNTVPHVFTCGPLDAIPTRWFRATVEDDELSVEAEGFGGDDLVIEAFSADSCDAPAQLACADVEPTQEDRIDVQGVTPGATFWIAVGIKGTPSGRPAHFRIDH